MFFTPYFLNFLIDTNFTRFFCLLLNHYFPFVYFLTSKVVHKPSIFSLNLT